MILTTKEVAPTLLSLKNLPKGVLYEVYNEPSDYVIKDGDLDPVYILFRNNEIYLLKGDVLETWENTKFIISNKELTLKFNQETNQ